MQASSITLSYLLNTTTARQRSDARDWDEALDLPHPANLYPRFKKKKGLHLGHLQEYIDTTSSGDMLVQLTGILLLYATIASLFVNMATLGSHFVLAFTVLLSGTFALVLSLVSLSSLIIPRFILVLSDPLG